MAKQTSVIVTEWGTYPDNPCKGVEVVEQAIPEPGVREVLVRLTLRPVNPADVFSICGIYAGFTPASLPATPGLEGLGVVDKNGEGASKFAKGQRVVGVPFDAKSGNGTWKQFTVVKEECLVAVPDSVSDATAAQFLVNPVSAAGMLDVLQVPQGKYVLQSAANSVLGRQFIQLAKSKGVRTINIVRRHDHDQELKDLGADEVICSADEDVEARVKEITGGEGAYGAIDPVGGEITTKMIKSLRNGGTILIYSAMSGSTFETPIPDLLYRGVHIRGFWLGVYLGSLGNKRLAMLQEVMGYLEDGTMSPLSGERFPLEKVKDAVAASMKPARGGKVLLEG